MTKKEPHTEENCKKTLTVYSKWVQRFRRYIIVPEIRLTGKWLARLHFNAGEKITIFPESGRILVINGVPKKVVL